MNTASASKADIDKLILDILPSVLDNKQKKIAPLSSIRGGIKGWSDNISLHLNNNIFKENELEENSVTEEFSITESDGKTYMCNFVIEIASYLLMTKLHISLILRMLKTAIFCTKKGKITTETQTSRRTVEAPSKRICNQECSEEKIGHRSCCFLKG
jgi:hypothetical protein